MKPTHATINQILFGSGNRSAVIKFIKTQLQTRSGKAWSVTGGKGSAYGWLTVDAPPARRTFRNIPAPGNEIAQSPGSENWIEIDDTSAEFGHTGPADRTELANLLGLDRPVHHQGYSIAAATEYYREAMERAAGLPVTKIAQPYWD
jgi:hypothetical protein